MSYADKKKRLQELDDEVRNSIRNSGTSSGVSKYSDSKTKKLDSIQQKVRNEQASSVFNRIDTWFKNHNNYINNYNSRYSTRKGTYEDSYVSDSGEWLDTISAQKSNFDKEASAIMSYLDQYGDYFGKEYTDSVKNAFQSALGQQSEILKQASSDKDYWSQFADENEYIDFQREAKKQKRYEGYAEKYAGMSYEDILTATNKLIGDEEREWLDANKYSLIPEADDFAENSNYRSTYRGGEKFNAWSGTYTDSGFDDIAYDYINRNETAKKRQGLSDLQSKASFLGLDNSERGEMTDDEIATFNYLYATRSPEEAYEYIDYLTSDLNARQRETEAAKWAKYANESPVGASVLSVIESPLKGLSYVGQIADYASDGKIDQNEGYNKFSYINSAIRNEVTKKVEEKWGGVGSFAYQTGMSMGDFLFNTAITGGNSALSLALMGSGAAADTVISSKDRRLNDNQAFLLGTIAGAAEIITEKFSIDALLDATTLGKSAVGYILKNTLAEGSEEVGSSLINLMADILVAKDKSAWQAAIDSYIDDGMSESAAFWHAVGDQALSLGLDFLGGAISGGLMGGGGAIVGAVGNTVQGKKYKNTYGADIGSALAGEAVEISPDSKFAQRMQAKAEAGKELSNRRVGKLLQQNETAMRENDVQSIKTGAANRLTELGETGDIDVIATALTKQVTGERLTFTEREAVKSSKYGERVANELNPENINSGGYSSAWAEKIGTDRINAAEYGRMIAELEHDATDSKFDPIIVSPPDEPKEEADATVSETEKVQQVTGKLPASKADSQPDTNVGDKVAQTGEVEASEGDHIREVTKKVGETPATLKEDGKDAGVKVKEISSVKDGKITVKLDSGEVVDASKVDFANEDTALVYQAAAEMSQRAGYNEDTVKVLVNGFESSGLNAAEYLHAFRDSFNYGAAGTVSVSALEKGKYTSLLSKKQRELAFHFGKVFGEESAQKAEQERARIENEKTASAEKEANAVKTSGEVIFDGSVNQGSLSKAQNAQIKVLRGVSSALGAKIRLFASEATVTEDGRRTRVFSSADGEAITANGWYDNETGEIWIDVNAGVDGNGLILFTAAHELTHFIKDWSSEKYNAFANFLISQYAENGVSVDELIEAQIEKSAKRGREMTREEAFDEVVADSCESFLTDSNAAEKIAALNEKDATLAEKIKSYIHKLLVKIRNLLKGIDPDSEEGKIVRGMTDSLEKLYELWTDALADAGQNYGQADMGSDKGSVQYSERYQSAEENPDILSLAKKVESGNFKANDKVYLGVVSEKLAKKIESLTGINVAGFKVAIEARQMAHILKDHGKNGKADRSMADLSDIAKMEYTLNNYDNINAAGRTLAYSYMVNGKNRTAPTVLYEKAIGEKSYYVVQAVPETKTKTLFIVTAFIGKSGYKKEVSQLINAKSPDATSEFGSATTSGSIISHLDGSVNSKSKKFSERDTASARAAVSEFGTTSDFSHAGFAIFDGRMLKLSQYGQAGVKHRNIERIYADTKGDGAIARFIQEGNVRISAASPGVEMSADIAPTVSQLNTISRFISNSLRNRGVFYLDITDSKGENAVSIAYDEDASTSDIVYDIKDYYERGRIPQRVYSERDPDAISSREVLANALEGAVQNDIEAERLAEYKSKIEKFDAEEQKLRQLRAEIKELSFAPGKRDNARLAELRAEAEKTANRINIYDKQLLRLEASKPLEGILQREKQKAYKRAKADAAEKMNDMRAVGVREKIKKIKAEIERELQRPTDRAYIPTPLGRAMIEVCSLIDTDTPLIKKDGTVNRAQEKREKTKERLSELAAEYENLKNNDDYMLVKEHDEQIDAYLKQLRNEFDDVSIKDMSLDQLREFHDILRSIVGTLRDARKVIGKNDAKSLYEYGNDIISEQKKIGEKRGERSNFQKQRDKRLNLSLSPMRNIERMSGYNPDSALVEITRDFEEGVRKKNFWEMGARKSFDSLITGKNEKNYQDSIYKEFGKEYTDSKDRKFRVSKMQMMQAILSYEREISNAGKKHIEKGGLTFADLKLLEQGKTADAVSGENAHNVPNAAYLVADFISALANDKWAQDYMAAAREFFNKTAKDAINDTYLRLKHRIIARDKNYIPYEVDKTQVVRDITNMDSLQQTINSYGILQDTQKNAPQALIITGLNNMVDRHIDQVGSVYGLAIPVRNFNKIWNIRESAIDSGQGKPITVVQGVIEENWGADGKKFIEQMVTDLQGARKNTRSELERKIESGYIGATFALNLSVVMKQIGSLYTANSELDRSRAGAGMLTNLAYTMAHFDKLAAEVDKYTAAVYNRRQGLSDNEVHTFITQAKKSGISRVLNKLPAGINPTKWITFMDASVALSLWKYVKADVAKNTKLKGEELLKETAKRFDSLIENTQSMSDVLHKPEIQKRQDVFSKSFAMFKTDLYQSAGQLRVMAGRYQANKSDANKKALTRTVVSIARSAAWNSLMTTLFALLRYKVNPYRDDEEELTPESWLKRQGVMLAGDFAGYLFPIFGSEIVGLIENVIYGESEEAVDSLALTLVNDLVDSITTIGNAITEGEMPDASEWENLLMKSAQLLGIPLSNIKRTVKAIRLHAEDIANGEFLSFEAGANKTDAKQLYDAVISGNDKRIEKAEALFDDQKAIDSALRKGLRENDVRIKAAARMLNSGDIRGFAGSIENISGEGIFDGETVEAAIRAEASAFNSKIKDAAEAKRDGKTDDYIKIVKELRESYRGVYTQDEIVEAVNSYTFEDVVEDDVEEVESVYKNSDINAALESGDTETAGEIIKELIEVKTENNFLKAQREAEESGKRFKEKEARTRAELDARSSIRSSLTNYWKKRYIAAYESGNEAEINRISELLYSTGIYGNRKKYLDEVLEGWLEK